LSCTIQLMQKEKQQLCFVVKEKIFCNKQSLVVSFFET